MKNLSLNGTNLKWIAVFSMLLDHIGAVIFEGSPKLFFTFRNMDMLLRMFGRIAFPIFCFLLVEGFLHTSNRMHYGRRLFFFALLSEIPFDLALNNCVLELSNQNVFFTLFAGYVSICMMERFWKRPYVKYLFPILGGIFCWLFNTDYSFWGVLLIFVFYKFYTNLPLRTLAGCLTLYWEMPAWFAFLPINCYNGKRGAGIKYFFYAFYPLHLLALTAVRFLLVNYFFL